MNLNVSATLVIDLDARPRRLRARDIPACTDRAQAVVDDNVRGGVQVQVQVKVNANCRRSR
jgi:hypothetical protein